jgi:hypothetical protein
MSLQYLPRLPGRIYSREAEKLPKPSETQKAGVSSLERKLRAMMPRGQQGNLLRKKLVRAREMPKRGFRSVAPSLLFRDIPDMAKMPKSFSRR